MTSDKGALCGLAERITETCFPGLGAGTLPLSSLAVVRGMGLRKTVIARTFHEEPRKYFIYMFDAGGC